MTYSEYLKDNNLTGKMYRDFLIDKMRFAEKDLLPLGGVETKRYILDIMEKLYELDNGKSE